MIKGFVSEKARNWETICTLGGGKQSAPQGAGNNLHLRGRETICTSGGGKQSAPQGTFSDALQGLASKNFSRTPVSFRLAAQKEVLSNIRFVFVQNFIRQNFSCGGDYTLPNKRSIPLSLAPLPFCSLHPTPGYAIDHTVCT